MVSGHPHLKQSQLHGPEAISTAGVGKYFRKEPDSKYVRLCEPRSKIKDIKKDIYIIRERTSFHIFIDEIQNNCTHFLRYRSTNEKNGNIFFLDSILLHWGSKLVFPNMKSIANIHP